MDKLDSFLAAVADCVVNGTFDKLTLSKPRDRDLAYKNVFCRLVEIKQGRQLSLVLRYPTNDITRNLSIPDGLALIGEMVRDQFVHADLFAATAEWHMTTGKNGDISLKKKQSRPDGPSASGHDQKKKRLIAQEGNVYLRELGILTEDFQVKRNSEDKYRQINKFVEVVGGVIEKRGMQAGCSIVDMGSGKGYLTFALYDYLVNTLGLTPRIVGIELRQHLVDTCNGIAQQAGFDNLHFHAGTIEGADLGQLDILIALHACDTATDDAIYRGLQANAEIIVCAPCCHKQLRKQIDPVNDLREIVRFGILEERQAEILTDAIRALVLKAHGYRTQVFEFISSEHTAKNVMIVAVKAGHDGLIDAAALDQIRNIKALYGIRYHYLERLLGLA